MYVDCGNELVARRWSVARFEFAKRNSLRTIDEYCFIKYWNVLLHTIFSSIPERTIFT